MVGSVTSPENACAVADAYTSPPMTDSPQTPVATKQDIALLMDGTLDTRNPDLAVIARQSERPAGIYVWAIHAHGVSAAAIPL